MTEETRRYTVEQIEMLKILCGEDLPTEKYDLMRDLSLTVRDKTQRFPMRDEEKAREENRIKLYDGVKN